MNVLSHSDRKPPRENWWKIHENLVTVLEYGIDQGEIVTAVDALRFVEKPFNYSRLHQAWEHDRDVQGELQDERRATL